MERYAHVTAAQQRQSRRPPRAGADWPGVDSHHRSHGACGRRRRGWSGSLKLGHSFGRMAPAVRFELTTKRLTAAGLDGHFGARI